MSRIHCLVPMLLVVATSSHAVVTRHDVPDAKYRVEASDFPALIDLPHEGHGVLISDQWILTAAHAVSWHPVTSLSINGSCRPVAEVIVHPGYRKPTKEEEAAGMPSLWAALAASDDVALIKLAAPTTDIAPVTLYRDADEQGKLFKFYGKGATGTGLEGLAEHASHRTELRRAYNHITVAEGSWLSARFDSGAKAHALEGTSGNGDSGGPLLIESDGAWKLAGITSWTAWDGDIAAAHPGKYGQLGKAVRVSQYVEWIDEVMRSHAGPASIDQTLQQLGSRFVAADKADGLSIALVEDGQARYYNFGSISRDRPQAPTEATVYEIGSVTKVFTSLLLAHAVAEGKAGLQDDVRKYLPGDYPGLSFEGTPVRLIDLATTTSALPDNLPDFSRIVGTAGPDEAPRLVIDALRRYSNAQLLEDLGSAKLVGRPGAMSRHSNVAANLLAIALERAYGDRYENLIARYVEKPFGMASGIGDSRSAQFATGYSERRIAMPPIDARAILPAGGLRYSTSDMAKFLIAELRAADAPLRLSQQVAWGDPAHSAIGFNWIVGRTADGRRRLSTSGGTFGQASHVEMVPELGYGIVLFANRSGQAQGELQGLASEVLAAVRGKKAGAEAAPTP